MKIRKPKDKTATLYWFKIKELEKEVRKEKKEREKAENENEKLRKELEAEGFVFEGTVDSEVLLYILAKNYINGNILNGVKEIFNSVEGAYSTVAIVDNSLFVFRDPYSIRPLVWGENDNLVIVMDKNAQD